MLKISTLEQADFPKGVFDGSVGISAATRSALQEVSLIKVSAGHALHGKTGSGPLLPGDFDGPFGGWFVGWVVRDRVPTATFALYAQGPDYRSIRTARLEAAEFFLKTAWHLPMHWE